MLDDLINKIKKCFNRENNGKLTPRTFKKNGLTIFTLCTYNKKIFVQNHVKDDFCVFNYKFDKKRKL